MPSNRMTLRVWQDRTSTPPLPTTHLRSPTQPPTRTPSLCAVKESSSREGGEITPRHGNYPSRGRCSRCVTGERLQRRGCPQTWPFPYFASDPDSAEKCVPVHCTERDTSMYMARFDTKITLHVGWVRTSGLARQLITTRPGRVRVHMPFLWWRE